MKKLFFCLFLSSTFYFLSSTPTHALKLSGTQTPSPTSTAKKDGFSIEQQISDLKEKIASRVAQLKLVEKRGIIGTVTDVSNTQITLSDIKGNIRLVDVDELTKFSSPSAKGSFGISDVTKGTTLTVLGLYNKDSRRMLGRFVDVATFPAVLQGVVTHVDSDNFTITIMIEDGKQYLADVENTTKTYAYTADEGKKRVGFSRIDEGQRVYLVGFLDLKNAKEGKPLRLSTSRILLFPNQAVNPKIQFIKPAVKPTSQVTPSVGSGKKLTPITR